MSLSPETRDWCVKFLGDVYNAMANGVIPTSLGANIASVFSKVLNRSDRAGKSVWLQLRYDVLRAANGRCALCGRGEKDGITLEADHIIPRARGGADVRENLQSLCNECNLGKSDRYADRWSA